MTTQATDQPPHGTPLTIGETIMLARKRLGMTQSQLADKAGVSRNMISLVERNRANVTIGTLIDISAGLGCRIEIGLIENKKSARRRAGG